MDQWASFPRWSCLRNLTKSRNFSSSQSGSVPFVAPMPQSHRWACLSQVYFDAATSYILLEAWGQYSREDTRSRTYVIQATKIDVIDAVVTFALPHHVVREWAHRSWGSPRFAEYCWAEGNICDHEITVFLRNFNGNPATVTVGRP